MMPFLLILLVVSALLAAQAWHDNHQMNKSWHTMHEAYLRQMGDTDSYGSIGWKANTVKGYYSQRLLSRLYPALEQAAGTNSSFNHSMIFPVSQ